ncbi:Cytochrome c oxidase subunit VIIc, partial [Trinorchestia longiramus]
QNLPFNVNNKYRLCAGFFVFIASGFGAPFFMLRHQLKKK